MGKRRRRDYLAIRRGSLTGRRGEAHPASKVSDADRLRAVALVVSGRLPPKAVALDCGVMHSTVCAWLRAAGYARAWVRLSPVSKC